MPILKHFKKMLCIAPEWQARGQDNKSYWLRVKTCEKDKHKGKKTLNTCV